MHLRSRLVGLLVALCAAAAFGVPASVQAATSCGRYTTVHSSAYNGPASYCPLWRGNVPVFGKDKDGYVDPSRKVGTLNAGGSSNWFICKWAAGRRYSFNGYSSVDYAKTVADNGRKGWVSAVFFAGTTPYWVGLKECEFGYSGW